MLCLPTPFDPCAGLSLALSPHLGRRRPRLLRGDPDAAQPGEGDTEALQHVPRKRRGKTWENPEFWRKNRETHGNFHPEKFATVEVGGS